MRVIDALVDAEKRGRWNSEELLKAAAEYESVN
jgi:hypothetical protein